MVSVISAIFVVGILVFVHEFGHFIVAKSRKVRVEKFSLGFGPEIISRKLGDTRYILSLIPLGGYVKMAGESQGEESRGEPYEYSSKTVWERLCIIASGPFMNVVLCIVILIILFSSGFPYVPGRVGTVLKDSPAEKAGLISGDIIKEIDGKAIPDWTSLTKIIRTSADKLLRLKVRRADEEFDIEIMPRLDETSRIGLIGITPYYGRKIGNISKNSTAYKAGLRQGDEIIEVSGISVSQWNEITELIEKGEDNRVPLTVLRKNEIAAPSGLAMTESKEEIQINFVFEREEKSRTPILDFYPSLPEKKYNPVISLGKAFSYTYYLIKLVYVGLWKLVTGQVSVKLIGGPILIAQLAGQEAQMGLSNLFMFIAIISVHLAVLNVLPIPVLDGGHIMFLIIEGISGRPVTKKKQEIAQQIGIAFLIGLMLLATYNDILRFLQK